MSAPTKVTTDSDSPFNYLTAEQGSVLRSLLAAVPEAKKHFDEGSVQQALATLRSSRVKLNKNVGIDKAQFLGLVNLAMPNKYSA